MNDTTREQFLGNVAGALRDRQQRPTPPDRTPTRLISSGSNIRDLFVKNVEAAGMHICCVADTDAAGQVVEILRKHNVQSAFVTGEPILKLLGVAEAVAAAGIRVLPFVQADDDLFAAGAGVTAACYGVAETGSIVLVGSADSPRQASLVPPVHIAALREDQLVPDLLDLMDVLARSRPEDLSHGMCMVTGPSKSADIELALVKGVHGPGHEYVLLLPATR